MRDLIKWGVLAIVVVAAIGVGWFFIRSGSGEASAPVTAPPVTTEAPVAQESAASEATEPSEEAATQEDPTVSEGPRIFAIVPGESEARFVLQEDLNGNRIDVIGHTTEVAGEISADPADLTSAAVGTVVINVRTIETGNSFRDRAIRGNILDSAQDEFEFSMFVPTEIGGLPASVEIGEMFVFTIAGDLTVRDVTSPVFFDVEASLSDANTLNGFASAGVTQEQFGITIDAPAQVANISEAITLELEFVAIAQ